MAGLTLDSGALIAAERDDRRLFAILKESARRDGDFTVPAGALAQVWRGNNPRIALLLRACEIESLTEDLARAVGTLLAKSKTTDVVDASVVAGAVSRGDAVVTSDPDDISRIAESSGLRLVIIPI